MNYFPAEIEFMLKKNICVRKCSILGFKSFLYNKLHEFKYWTISVQVDCSAMRFCWWLPVHSLPGHFFPQQSKKRNASELRCVRSIETAGIRCRLLTYCISSGSYREPCLQSWFPWGVVLPKRHRYPNINRRFNVSNILYFAAIADCTNDNKWSSNDFIAISKMQIENETSSLILTHTHIRVRV